MTSDRGSGVGSLMACDQLRVWKYPSLSWQERNIAFIFPLMFPLKPKANLTFASAQAAQPVLEDAATFAG